MSDSLSTSYQNAERAIAGLKAAGLAASTKNIELWLQFSEGRNPALARDFHKATRPDGKLLQSDADALYDAHILKQGLSRDIIDLIQRFEDEMMKIADVVESTGANASGNSDKLRFLSTELKRSASGNPAIGALMDSVLSVAKSVREANERLEDQLAKSSDEVVTLRRNIENIQQEAMLDPLTGVKNRKTFDTELLRLMRDATGAGQPLALIMADVDHFKQFNDRWGHQTGDHVLRLVADVMNANIKGQDVLARYGGEEFAIILPGTTLQNAVMLADRIRKAVESRRLKKRRTDEDLGVVTLSMGAALLRWNDTAESLIERADGLLYSAKNKGRNCVVDEEGADPSGAETSAA
ncbi:MAG TPA: GGDEF domain-containing protein [Parvularcula sp.]|nr:GGDEF domain-containing protein [Parvularcula sp.]HBS32285.1 GGDEF domain-containing protein [Parvularcula sp.]HBS36716.1 GGDEF domain-containing protein [Parvularcula sp.]